MFSAETVSNYVNPSELAQLESAQLDFVGGVSGDLRALAERLIAALSTPYPLIPDAVRDQVLDLAGSIDAWRSAMDTAVVLGEAIVRRVSVFESESSTRGIERVRAAYPGLADRIDDSWRRDFESFRANAAAAAVIIERIEDHIDSLEAEAASARGEFISLDALKASLDL